MDVDELFPKRPPVVVLLDVPNNPVPDDVDVAVVAEEPNENPVDAELVAAGFAPNNPPPVVPVFVVFVVLDCPNVNVMVLNVLSDK